MLVSGDLWAGRTCSALTLLRSPALCCTQYSAQGHGRRSTNIWPLPQGLAWACGTCSAWVRRTRRLHHDRESPGCRCQQMQQIKLCHDGHASANAQFPTQLWDGNCLQLSLTMSQSEAVHEGWEPSSGWSMCCFACFIRRRWDLPESVAEPWKRSCPGQSVSWLPSTTCR